MTTLEHTQLHLIMLIFRRMAVIFLMLAIAGLAMLSLWHGVLNATADAKVLRSRWMANQWRSDTGITISSDLWQQVVEDHQSALQMAPDNAELLDNLGFLYAGLASGINESAPNTDDHALQRSLFVEALNSYRQATHLRHTFPYSWMHLAQVKFSMGEIDAELWIAYDKAFRYGHNEPGVQLALARIAFAQWENLDDIRKAQITQMIDQAPPSTKRDLLDLGRSHVR